MKVGEAMSETKSTLKDRLKEALEMREKKSVDLVRDLKIPKSAISQYLSGKSQNMDSERLYKICNYLNVSEPWLLGYDVPTQIKKNPAQMAELHYEIIMDEDITEIFSDFKKLDAKQRKIIKNLIHDMAESEV